MATLLLTAVGTILGGPIGGAIGALAGRQIDNAIVGGRTVKGPRLKELNVQSSSYGDALPLHFGTVRTAGTVIWSTELVEHEETSGGGKGRPKVKTYTYTVSFAVALSSRPIGSIGRVWADGNLLRGSAGDLKVGGTMRVHTGHGDQAPDPLMAQAEAAGRCPAHRGVAIAVFEDLELANFGNRIPSLSFEVLADDGCTVAKVLETILPEADCSRIDQAFDGFSIDQGAAGDTITAIGAAIPLSAWVDRGTLVLAHADRPPYTLPVLAEPSATEEDGGRAPTSARWSKRREPLPQIANCAIRYYDPARDFQPGFQRGKGRSERGELQVIDLPAAIDSDSARAFADAAALRRSHAMERITYRTAEIDPALLSAPLVEVPVARGIWRIEDWEWQKDGVLLNLAAVPALQGQTTATASTTDPGRYNAPADLAITPTLLNAFELPWDGSGDGNQTPLYVAASSSGGGWRGAALFGRKTGGAWGLVSLGSAAARRAVIGQTIGALAAGSPMVFDQINSVDIQLVSMDFALADADVPTLLANAANRALIGSEIVQFGKATPLGGGRWRISSLLRGRGGTEWAIATHGAAGEPFVLLDDRLTQIADTQAGELDEILGVGLNDTTPAAATIMGTGSALQPLNPVHGQAEVLADGAVRLSWVRRARGAWRWLDQVEVPLNEESESWDIVLGTIETPLARWAASTSTITIPAAQLPPGGSGSATFLVRQIGRNSMSRPLAIPLP